MCRRSNLTGKSGNSRGFRIGKGILCMLCPLSGDDGLHLNGHSPTRVQNQKVQFTPPHPNIAINDGQAATSEEEGCDVFAESPHPAPTQIWTPGSSSSMLTSRKVITRTF